MDSCFWEIFEDLWFFIRLLGSDSILLGSTPDTRYKLIYETDLRKIRLDVKKGFDYLRISFFLFIFAPK